MNYIRELWKNTPPLRWLTFIIVIAAGVALAMPAQPRTPAPTSASAWDRLRRWVPFLPHGGMRRPLTDDVQSAGREALSVTREAVKEATDMVDQLRRDTTAPNTGNNAP